MDNFFISLKDGLTIRNIPQVSRACSRVKGFGEYSSNYSYGMLDSINLINQLVRVQKSEEADKLLKAIDCMVVYKSGNVEDANGISICYPNNTDDTYRYAYMYISEQVDFRKAIVISFLNYMTMIKAMKVAEVWIYQAWLVMSI